MEIKTKILFLFVFCIFLHADEANKSTRFVKAYVDHNISAVFKKTKSNVPDKKDYIACREKNKGAFVNLYGVEAVVVDEHHAISFSKEKPSHYQVYNPFYEFYVLYTNDYLENVTMADENNLTKKSNLGAIYPSEVNFGKFLKDGAKDTKWSTFTNQKGSLIIDPCCNMYGIGIGGREFLPNSYLEDIVKRKEAYNGYIGVTFSENEDGIFVKNIDPNILKIPFCPDDKIISINGKAVTSKAELELFILSAPKGNVLDIGIERNGKIINVKSTIVKRPKYGLLNMTYLEALGANFDHNLVITHIKKPSFAASSGLKVGDRLKEINFKSVKTPREARNKIMFSTKNEFQLLISRHDFDFFVKFQRDDIKGGLIAFPHCKPL